MSTAKKIDTLVEDIHKVVETRGGWDSVVNEHFKHSIGATMMGRLGPEEEPRASGTLRMSSIGQPCERKLWYQTNKDGEGEALLPSSRLKFLFGDMLEDLLLSLAKAAGHTVEGQQDTMTLKGIKGHRDAVIDGVTVDVKSASSYSYKKFKDHNLEYEDPFGYLWQLTSYVKAAEEDPLVKDKKGGAFLVIDKQHGHICLDYYDLEDTGHLGKVEELYDKRKESSKSPVAPPRGFKEEPEGKSGNMKLGINCSYCDFKKVCHPNLRTFLYARNPVFLTKVVKEPKVMEIKNG